MKAIIFGAAGQDGFYLSRLLQKENCTVIPVYRENNNLLIEYNKVVDLIKNNQPDYIFHLAANSTTKHEVLFENYTTISTGTLNILEAVKNFSPHTKVFISGSGLQFKNEAKPIKESDQFEARDAYSMARIQSVYAARYYKKLGLKVYVGYFFNHDSPLRTERHMSKKITEAAKRISKGSTEKLEIGDITVKKEWTFAGDVVNAVWTLVKQDKIYEAVIGSGIGYSIEEWLQQCFSIVDKNWKEHVIVKNDFIPEYSQLVSDPALIFSLGWRPEISFEQLAEMMMNDINS
jgi:GDPmannose 4,6-dehydratase